MRDPEAPCARCGRRLTLDALKVWEEQERFRIFNGPPAYRAAAAGAEAGVYRYVYRRFAHLVCERCEARLKRGARVNDVHNRRVALWLGAILAFAGLAFLFTPVLMPTLLAAFWWW
jgi:hypothetical protein